MASLESRVQGIIHGIEQGGATKWVQLTILCVGIIGLSLLYLLVEFKGLSEPQGMEQAQIARELARGNGFSTKTVRPLAIWQFSHNGRAVPEVNFPDTYHAPLPSLVYAFPLLSVRQYWKMGTKDFLYVGDRMIAITSVLCFLAALFVNYLIGVRLFDRKLSLLATGLLLLCDLFWQFALSGLPQMLMLLIFSLAVYCLLRAVQNVAEEKGIGFWLSATGILFGLLALSHALTIWMFVGVLIFAAFYFRPRLIALVLLAGFFMVTYSPWLLRTYAVSGSPGGVAIYSALGELKQSEDSWMRSYEPDFSDLSLRLLRSKVQDVLLEVIGNIYNHLGWCIAAPFFFIALLHPFKTRQTSLLRWAILPMWILAIIGTCVFGIGKQALTANNLQILFVPLMALYGLAMLVLLWNRHPFDHKFLRYAFYTFLYLVSSVPVVTALWPGGRGGKVHWPPYVPPFIAILGDWVESREVIVSDMPWAVGWYADRRSLWVPLHIADFVRINDYNELGGPLVGLYLTPVSGDRKFLSEIGRGEFKDWAGFILRNPNTKDFPLKTGTALPVDNQCIFFSDRDRWTGQASIP